MWALDNLDDFYPQRFKEYNLQILNRCGNAFNFVKVDILEFEALCQLCQQIQFDVIVHLAAKAGVRPSLKKPAIYQRINVEGTANVLEAARLTGVRKFIFASSSSVYGIGSRIPFSESEPVRTPASPYAASKIAGEALAHTYHHLYGLDVIVLRYFTVYGPRQRPDLAIHKFARLIWTGKPIPVYGDPGKSARDYTFIDDIINGTIACMERLTGYHILNLGRSDMITIEHLVRLLEQALERPAKIDYLPPQPGDLSVTCADISRARTLIGYNPTVSIETGIARFAEWFKTDGVMLLENS